MSGGERATVWKIHPAIGIANVGNSPADFIVGPEAADDSPGAATARRDGGDADNLFLPRIKRKGAEFRIFGYEPSGKCVGEVTADSVKAIHWNVRLANTKGSSHKIGANGTGQHLRNRHVPAGDRWKLEITPLPQVLTRPNQRAAFDDGAFMGIPVSLGEIRTDSKGRLLVLGGLGKTATCDGTKRIRNFTDNDYWYDDVSDGPVTGRITLSDGRVVDTTPAWVIVTPPNYTPEFTSVATLYDVLADQAIADGRSRMPARPSFVHEILPILNRIALLPWVTQCAQSAAHKIQDRLKALAQNGTESRSAREGVLAELLKHAPQLKLTGTQWEMLKQWQSGEFESDWTLVAVDGEATGASKPDEIDRAALESCAGGVLFPDLSPGEAASIFLAGDPLRLDHSRLQAGALTRSLACPWQADFIEQSAPWSPMVAPDWVLTAKTYEEAVDLDKEIAALPKDSTADDQYTVLERRRAALWAARQPWARDLPIESPAREESLIREWQHLGFVASHGHDGTVYRCAGQPCYVETERNICIGTLADYFHRLVNIESNRDFTGKALEIALQMLGDAKFNADPKFAPFRYTPDRFDAHLDRIYADYVDTMMFKPVPWECGEITWDAVIDYDEDSEPIRRDRIFHVGKFSDRALTERFRQLAPLNLTDGAWLQNILSAGPIDSVVSRLFSIWTDEAGNGRIELNHANVYNALLHSLNIYMPPVTSRDFIEQDFVRTAFESPVFQFCVGLFPRRFLPELLGMTLFVEWEATPSMHAIAKMMAERHIDPQYYRMHAAIDNGNVGHGALAKQAVKLYLHQKGEEGGDAAVQEHWQRIWRGFVAWATLGNGPDEVLERIMLVDKKQIHRGSSLLLSCDILPPLVAALRSAKDPVSSYLRDALSPATSDLLSQWSAETTAHEALLDGLCKDLNATLKTGIYERARFERVRLSSTTKTLLDLQPKRGVDLVDLGRALLEDAYPQGLARRPAFPDIKRYHAQRMTKLIENKMQLAMRSHRALDWLMDAFRRGPAHVMQMLRVRGFIDIDHPTQSKLFRQTEFNGSMYKVFTDEERAVLIDWMESLRDDEMSQAIRPEPVTAAKPAQAAFEWFSARGPEAPRDKTHEVVSLNAKSGKVGAQGQQEQERLPEKRGWAGLGAVH